MWSALKARKANLIDQKALDVISRLVKEPATPESDAKIHAFALEFFRKTSPQDQQPDANLTNCATTQVLYSAHLSKQGDVLYLRLPPALLEIIAGFLSFQDAVSLASTCYAMNSAVFPPSQWPKRIKDYFLWFGLRAEAPNDFVQQPNAEDEEEHEGEGHQHNNDPLFPHPPVIQEIGAAQEMNVAAEGDPPKPPPYFSRLEADKILSVLETADELFKASRDTSGAKQASAPNNPLSGDPDERSKVLVLFARGARMLGASDQRSLGYEIMLRYLLPRVASGSLQVKSSCSLMVPGKGRLASGPQLSLTHALGSRSGQKDHIWLKFQAPYSAVPPIIASGASVSLHALHRDRRSVSLVRTWRCGGAAQKATMPLMMESIQNGGHQNFQDTLPTLPGRAGVTLVGERAARQLGILVHGDEMAYSVEIRSSAIGSHGQGSYDVRNVQEVITYQTPRIGFKAPGYFEVSRNGVELNVPLWCLFDHVV